MELKVTGLWSFAAAAAHLLGFYILIIESSSLPRPIKNDVWFYVKTSAGSQEKHIHQANNAFIYHLGSKSPHSHWLERPLCWDNLNVRENCERVEVLLL